ncbi:hypothetical protein ACIBG7_18555 [Nonomuraea sp. NPDC050328]|uniref:hypothetical protein n=1 Tax=Nonomuraea sp. NPDC050328 TaxID=3364361 RepID=UPI00379C096E
MPAETRSLVSRVAPGAVARGAAQPGDIILAWSTASFGANADLTITGGGTWQPLGEFPSTSWAGARVWGKTVGADEPEEYTVTQDSVADGVVILHVIRDATLAGLQLDFDTSNMAPGLTPSSPSGIEIRYSAGLQNFGATTWAALPGYTQDQVQTGAITATLAARPYASTSPLDAAGMLAAPTPTAQRAVTLLIQSTDGGTGGGQIPTPIPFPPFAPAKGIRTTSFVGLDLLTGEFRGDLPTLKDVSLDGRINEPGSFSATIPLTSPLEAAKAAEVFPPDEYDLSAGVGRTVLHTWRGGQLWGPHWIHTVIETRNQRSGKVELQIQGVTLDGYLAHVALQQAIEFDFGDQLDNFRALVQVALDDPGSNVGLTLGAGTSASLRPLKGDIDAYIGQLMQSYAKALDGFEYTAAARLVDGAVLRTIELGAPKLDFPLVTHEFVESPNGGDTLTWSRTRSALTGYTRLGVIGGTPQQADITTTATAIRSELIEASAHRAAGWPWIDKRLRHDSTDQTTIDEYAAYWAARAPGAPAVFQATVLLGAGSSFGPNSIGEYARISLNNPRYPLRTDGSPTFDRLFRIIGWQLQPRTRGRGKDRLTLVLEGAALS